MDRSPALQARGRLLVDPWVAHLSTTLAEELAVDAEDIVIVALVSVLTAWPAALLDQARRNSLQGLPIGEMARRLTDTTNRAFDLLTGEVAVLGATSTRVD